jgi:3-oxoacyl-[acyl-carrier protein] reductase
MKLEEVKALVTGGSSGIGYATAKHFRERGAAVAICGRDQAKLESAARALGVLGIVADVSREADVKKMVEQVIHDLGGYNVLINNAGFGYFETLVDTDADQFRAVWETNVLGATLVARESARHFVAQRRGNIINIASTSGKRGGPGSGPYTATKFALSGLTECWRAELRTSNVRVTQVNPSEVQTDFFTSSGRKARKSNPSKLVGEDIAQTIASMLEVEDRALITEVTVWATNPKD